MPQLTFPAKILEIPCERNFRDPPKVTHPQSQMLFLATLAAAALEIWTPTDHRSEL